MARYLKLYISENVLLCFVSGDKGGLAGAIQQAFFFVFYISHSFSHLALVSYNALSKRSSL